MTRELPVDIWKMVAKKMTDVEFCLAWMTAKSIKNFRYGVPMIPSSQLPLIEAFVDYAAGSGNPALLRWLIGHRFPCGSVRNVVKKVVRSKSLPMFKTIQMLDLFNLDHAALAIKEACITGWVEFLEYLYEACPFVFVVSASNVYATADDFNDFLHQCIDHGRIDCFKFLLKHVQRHQGTSPIQYQACAEKAAKAGRLNMLKALHEIGLVWDHTDALYQASKSGHLPCLTYIHQNGGTFFNIRLCADTKHQGCKDYLHANGFECEHTHPEITDAFRYMIGLQTEDFGSQSSEDFGSQSSEED